MTKAETVLAAAVAAVTAVRRRTNVVGM